VPLGKRWPDLETAPLREAGDWIDRFRRFWNMSLDRLDALKKLEATLLHIQAAATDAEV